MTNKLSLHFFLILAGVLFVFITPANSQCTSDNTAPEMVGNCPPIFTTIYTPAEGVCTVPVPFVLPTYTEDCNAMNLLGAGSTFFHSFLMGPGGGTIPPSVSFGTDSLRLRGVSDGTAGSNSQNNFCFFVYCSGTLSFDYFARMTSGDDFVGDRARVMIENAVTGTSSVDVLTPGTGNSIVGTRTIAVTRGDRVCFEINSDNTNGVDTLTLSNLILEADGDPEPLFDGPQPEDLLSCGVYYWLHGGFNCIGASDGCSGFIFVRDTFNPVITGCPDDILVDLSPDECDYTASWTAPTAEDVCIYGPGFVGAFAPYAWVESTLDSYFATSSGTPSGLDAKFSHDATTLSITGSNNGKPFLSVEASSKTYIPCNGTLNFHWEANILEPGAFRGDEAGYQLSGGRVVLTTVPSGSSASGDISIPVSIGQTIKFWVNSDNIAEETTLDITAFEFIPDPVTLVQTAGPASGDVLAPGHYVVEYTATGCCGEKKCTFNIDINANTIMACKNINVSLDQNCQALITPDAVLTSACPGRAIVELSHYGHPIPNPVDSSYLGKTIIATVIDTLTGNTCWSNVLIEDKLAPEILCQIDTMSCAEFSRELSPAIVEDCSHYTVTLLDERIEKLECDPDFIKRIIRVWVSTDDQGNLSDTCAQEIFIERLKIDDVLPPLNVQLDCEVAFEEVDEFGNPHPNVTGIPTLNGENIWPNVDFLCNFVVTYSDYNLDEIRCVRKIMRTWTVREWWCNTELTRTYLQVIEVVDDKGPKIIHSAYDFNATTGHRSCEADVILPPIEAVDACHNVLRIDVEYPGGILINQNGGPVKLPVGIDSVFYRLYDNCYNLTMDTLIVTVEDHTAPIAVCDRRTVVSINHSGYNWVPAEVFDDGSFDECHLHHFEVRRMDDNACGTTGPDDWGPEVGFCCEDVNQTIMVGLKVVDGHGNESICMILVEVQDKDMPLITCPPNITVDCRFPIDLNNLGTSFGRVVTAQADREPIVIDPAYWHYIDGHPQDGLATDNCPPLMREEIDSSGFNTCGLGVIKRWFIATDIQGNEARCCQYITVENHHPFDYSSIVFPEDLDTSGICDPTGLVPERLSAPYNYPTYSDDVCSLIGASFHDEIFSATVPGDPCFKIFRVWKIINWCDRDDNGNFIIFQDTQIIKVTNLIDPIIRTGCRDTTICSFDLNCRPLQISLGITATDDCTAANQLLYRYKVDFNSDGTIDLDRAGIGENIATGTWPLGHHIIKWEVEDRCGNTAKCSYNVNLLNCKSPTAYCLSDVAVGLVPMDLNGDGTPETKMVQVWASDIDAGSAHSCGYPVKLSFSRDTADKFRIYDCDSVGVRPVELWVTDINGNTSYCRTRIIVQDNPNLPPLCPNNFGSAQVSGLVKTEKGSEIQNVNVELVNASNIQSLTNYEGLYDFGKVKANVDYTILPQLNKDWLNGVSTADIVKIQKHILGVELFDSPYKMIAADANNSRDITARDISEIRKLILGVQNSFSSNTSWKFVDELYNFGSIDQCLKENYPTQYNITNLSSDMKVNFVGVKIGDVNESAKTRGLAGASVRSSQTLDLHTDNVSLSKDQVYTFTVKSDNVHEFEGMQFTLEFIKDKVELVQISGNDQFGFYPENFSLHQMNNGRVTFSWNGAAENGQDLFSITIKAKSPVDLSDVFFISSNVTPALAVYSGDDQDAMVKWTVRGASKSPFVLLQNEPNPWNNRTTLGMYIPENSTVNLSIYDANGKCLYVDARQMIKGYNEWALDKSSVLLPGVYYYQVECAGSVQKKKMVIVE